MITHFSQNISICPWGECIMLTIGSSHWLENLWGKRGLIADKPSVIFWGNKGIAFRKIEIEKWKTVFNDIHVLEFDEVGHFVQEELGDDLCPLVEEHLEKIKI